VFYRAKNDGTNHRKSNNSIPASNILKKSQKSYDPGKYILVESAKSDKENNKSGKSNNSIAGKNKKLSFSLAPDKERKPALF
jgi:hypothetical protein